MFESKDYETIGEEAYDGAKYVAQDIAKNIEANLKKEFANAKADYDINTDESFDDDISGYVTIKYKSKINVSIPIDEIDKNLNLNIADLTDMQIYDLGEKYINQYCIPELYDADTTEYIEEYSIDSIFADVRTNQFTFSVYYIYTYIDDSNVDDRDEYPY